MRLYEVSYCKNDYSVDTSEFTINVAATSAIRAGEFVGKRNGKFVGYSGRVTTIKEVRSTVHIAK